MRVKQKRIVLGMFLVLVCTLTIGMSAFAADVTMKNKKWMSGGASYVDTNNDGIVDTYQEDETTYYKFQIPKQGYIKVEVKQSLAPGEAEFNGEDWVSEDFTSVEFLNASKVKLDSRFEDMEESSNWTFTEAVKKGTYYLAVKSTGKYQIRYTFKAVAKANKTATVSSKAVKLSFGKTAKVLAFHDPSSDSSIIEHYYKIKLSKAKKITLTVNSKIEAGGDFAAMSWIDVFKKVGKKYVNVNSEGKTSSKYAYIFDFGGKITLNLPKGTYGIRVIPGGSGYYTIKWK